MRPVRGRPGRRPGLAARRLRPDGSALGGSRPDRCPSGLPVTHPRRDGAAEAPPGCWTPCRSTATESRRAESARSREPRAPPLRPIAVPRKGDAGYDPCADLLTGSGQGQGTVAQQKERCGEHRATRQRRHPDGLRRGAPAAERHVRTGSPTSDEPADRRRTGAKGAAPRRSRMRGPRRRGEPASRLSRRGSLSPMPRPTPEAEAPGARSRRRRRRRAVADGHRWTSDATDDPPRPPTPRTEAPTPTPRPPPPERAPTAERRSEPRRRPAPSPAPVARRRRLRRRRRAAGRRRRGVSRRHCLRGSGEGDGRPAASGDDTPPPLALDGYSASGGTNGIAPGEPNPYGATYRADGSLPDGPGSAPVYRPAGQVTEDEVAAAGRRRSASTGRRWRRGRSGGSGRKDGSGPSLQVNRQAPGTWTFHRYAPGTDDCTEHHRVRERSRRLRPPTR